MIVARNCQTEINSKGKTSSPEDVANLRAFIFSSGLQLAHSICFCKILSGRAGLKGTTRNERRNGERGSCPWDIRSDQRAGTSIHQHSAMHPRSLSIKSPGYHSQVFFPIPSLHASIFPSFTHHVCIPYLFRNVSFMYHLPISFSLSLSLSLSL